jgi:hypothetical protein
MKYNILIVFGINLLCFEFINSITLTDRKTSQIEVDFFRFLFPFDEFFNETNSTQVNSTYTVAIQTTTPFTYLNTTNDLTISPSLSQLSINSTLPFQISVEKTTSISTINQNTAVSTQSTDSTITNQNPSLDQIQAPSDYIIHKLYRKFLENIKRQTFSTIKINPSQTVNTNIPADLNVCTDQFSTNENGNSYCIDSTGEKRPVYEVIT